MYQLQTLDQTDARAVSTLAGEIAITLLDSQLSHDMPHEELQDHVENWLKENTFVY